MTWIYCKRLSGYIILMTCAAAHVHASTAGADNPHFVNVRLPYGLSVDVPQSWRVLGDEENQLIELSASAVLDLTGLTPEGDGDITLFAANSMPRSTYASIRVELLDAMDLSEAEAANLQPEDLADMNAGVLEMLNAILSAQGLALIDYYGTSLEWIQSKPCVSIRYRRSGPSGPVMTERLIVFSDESQWGINLAYRQSETGLWLPVINRIKSSINIQNESKGVQDGLQLTAESSSNHSQVRGAMEGTQSGLYEGVSTPSRSPRPIEEIVVSIVLNWLIGLLPAILLRYLVLRRPLSQASAKRATFWIGLILFLATVSFAHITGVRPNMGPLVIWIFITYSIFRAGVRIKSRAPVSDDKEDCGDLNDRMVRSAQTQLDVPIDVVVCPQCHKRIAPILDAKSSVGHCPLCGYYGFEFVVNREGRSEC